MMEDDQQFCLRWNNHQSTLISVFDTLLENEKLVDCTLAAEGRIMKAHKVVLSACSPYFATLLQEQYDKHPIFILKDVKYQELRAMMDYMYRGEVNISQDQLAALLKAAESLQIKGLSDNRTGAPPRAEHQQQQQHHRGLNVPGGSKLSGGYTLEAQSKRARVGAGQLDTQDMSGSREGSSSPSRRRRKVRRRSIENVMAEPHDNSNSSQQQQSSLLQSNAGLAGVSAITAAATALASQLPSVVGSVATPGSTIATTQAIASAQQQQQQQQQQPPQQQQQHQQQQQGQLMPTTTGVTKKTENVKGTTSDAMNTENVLCTVSGSAAVAVDADVMEQQQQHQQHHAKTDKQNHKQKQTSGGVAKDASEMVIEPKSEYDEEGNDETCEDLTLDDEDMGMDDLDQNAGTSQGGEGSSQGYAAWQHDRSQDEILLTQEAQQRDPQDINKVQVQDAQNQTQSSESRIRVRNWLMLADQSILEKSIKGTDSFAKAGTNQTNALTTSTSAGTQTNSTVVTGAGGAANSISVPAPKPLLDANVATMTRIGSIGRTTIACITPAGAMSSGKHSLNNGNSVGVVSAAALAAAGVELDTVDESMTEVIVKIENTATSDEECELPDEALQNDDDERELNYDLQLSSPMSWAYDAVKIENEEEFEEFCAGETNMDDDDDLLTTAAATTKQANAANANANADGGGIGVIGVRTTRSRSVVTKTRNAATLEVTTTTTTNANVVKKRTVQTVQQLQQQQQRLLEQQQHLQHLNLQPNQPLQIKLASIPATITSIAPKPTTGTPPSTAAGTTSTTGGDGGGGGGGGGGSGSGTTSVNMTDSKQAVDFQSSLSDDKRYRILIQNQRMRKESLEHSEDMIYNADIEKPWVCRNCNRNYKWKNSLKCHLKNECGQPPRYFCSKLCGYATNVHSNLKRHLNTKCRDRVDEESRNNAGSNNNSSADNNSSANNNTTYTLVLEKQE